MGARIQWLLKNWERNSVITRETSQEMSKQIGQDVLAVTLHRNTGMEWKWDIQREILYKHKIAYM